MDRMTVSTLTKRWGEVLILAGLQLVLTATLATGLRDELCGNNTLCGYGAKCENTTNRCKCLSVNDELRNRLGYPNSLFYCLGEMVTQCGHRLCGYRAECDAGVCRCSHRKDVLRALKDTSPHRFYCVELCSSDNRNCSENTTCRDPSNQNKYLCVCSEGARRSSAGQCLGKPSSTWSPSAPSVLRTTVSTQEDDSKTPVIGLSAGIGGAVLLAVAVAVAVLKHRRLKAGALENELSTELSHSYENTMSLSSPGENISSSWAVPTVDRPSLDDPANNSPNTYVNVSAPSQSSYENVRGGLYESANTSDTSGANLYTSLGQT